MDLTWTSIEELARTPDDVAVRRRFDERNRAWLIVLLFFFGVMSLIQTTEAAYRKTVVQVASGAVNLAFVAALMFAIWAPSVRAWTRRRVSPIAMGFLSIQYALVLSYSRRAGGWALWAATLPWMTLGFRMSAIEHVLVHGVFASAAVIMSFVSPPPRHPERILLFALASNVIALGLKLYFSRRMRTAVVGGLTEQRKQAREQIRMRDELHYARELQMSMLPECAPRLPWADICSVSVPATEVGGDYYDYFVEEDRVALVCGDVAGHGMAAGLVLSALRSGFTLLRDSLHDPAAVLRRLHDLVAQTSRRRMLVTVSVVLVDHASRRATIASAGHPPVILRHADGHVEALNLFAPPLGVRLPVQIPQRTIDVTAGDTFVLHSDGIYETRSPAGEDYGIERLEDVVRTHGGGSAEELRDTILREVAAFRGNAVPADDVTVVVCRVL